MPHGLLFSCRMYPFHRGGGVHRIATVLRQEGMDVEVVDFAPHWSLPELKEFVNKSVTSSTVFFGFGVFFNYWNDTVQQLVNWMKIAYPNIKVVLGGQSVLNTQASNIDIWVDSYGEYAMLEVVKSLAGNTSSGIKFDVTHFGSKKLVKALTSYPAYNMTDYGVYMEDRDYLQPYEWLTIEFARGCKFSCAFCNFPVLGVKEDNSRTGESFERELKYNFDKFGITNYFVADETFNDRPEKVKKFADVVDTLDFKPFFSGFVRADLLPANPEMLADMARMNFGGQYYGIETFSREAGKLVGKGMDPDRLKEYLLYIEKYMNSNATAYRGTISLIVGLPRENKDGWNSTVSWLKDNWTDQSIIVFPLDIPTANDASSNESKFTANLEKYGLRTTGSSLNTERNNDFWKEGHYGNDVVLWEHDDMNIYEARNLVLDFSYDIITEFKADNWQLNNMEFARMEKIADLKPLLNQSKFETHVHYESDVVKSFIKNYINKKLGYH